MEGRFNRVTWFLISMKVMALFLLAGLLEIGGGYLMWQWLREKKSVWFGVAGALSLVLYGVAATYQPANFGRVYAAYGGVFIFLSVLWGWKVDGIAPDRADVVGGLMALLGAGIIMFGPRG